ncbi:unnamed protein product [Paramecium octaurelia]|uniref:B30.2/SPRY domain-containing protein n=1 Tax=Paramecium octaurelia TaxID=43137 RepID=A0A8S1Y4A8_PAROT|nr:unnamed protein product [Paramecium octaurelia]
MDQMEGFYRSRFINYNSDCFDCLVCQHVARDPMECNSCGQVYCASCLPKICINCSTPGSFDKLTRVQKKIYDDLVLKCQFCELLVTVNLIEKHEKECNKQCVNFQFCGNFITKENNEKLCDTLCQLLSLVKKSVSKQEIYDHLKSVSQQNIVISSKIPRSFDSSNISTLTISNRWDSQKKANCIKFSDGDQKAFNEEQNNNFRTVVAKHGYESGIAYWEIETDDRNESELKIGVTKSKDFDLNKTCFCDYDFGWAFFTQGSLRHNHPNSGPVFAKRLKYGVFGVCLNMNQGQLMFSYNGEFLGQAFKDEKLKSGPIYPAVGLFNTAGCKITSGKPVPSLFPI